MKGTPLNALGPCLFEACKLFIVTERGSGGVPVAGTCSFTILAHGASGIAGALQAFTAIVVSAAKKFGVELPKGLEPPISGSVPPNPPSTPATRS